MKNIFPLLPLAAACLLLSPVVRADDAPQGNQFTVGGGVAGGARYAGARQSTFAPMLVLDYSHQSGFFASTLRGLGYGGRVGPVSYSAALGYRRERKEQDENGVWGSTGGDELRGMGDVKGNASAVTSVGYAPIDGLEFTVGADIPLSQRQNGKNVHAGVTGRLFNTATDKVTLGLAAGFGDSEYNQTYYGVTAVQAATSKFAAYKPKAGLYEATAMLSWQRKFGTQWSVTSMVGASHLLKEASKSPLVQRKTSPVGAIYATYSY